MVFYDQATHEVWKEVFDSESNGILQYCSYSIIL